jgi:hypothetical protein
MQLQFRVDSPAGSPVISSCLQALVSWQSLKGASMDIRVSEGVYQQLEQVKEWMESKIGREVTFDDVLLEILKNFQMVLHPEDLGSA